MLKKIKSRFIIAVLLSIFVFFGIGMWSLQAFSPVDEKDKTPLVFVISPGESVRSIASRLRNEGLIRDSIAFFLTVKFQKLDNQIQAGDFRLSKAMNVSTVAQELTHGSIDVWLTTIEGWRVEEIALKLAQELSIPEREFVREAKEGYMFPDTYLIPHDATAGAIAQMFRDTFSKRFDAQLQQKVKSQGLTVDQAVTLASIVEREALFDRDRPIIAGILLKRLANDWPLDADATVQYALGYQSQGKTWWKKSLTAMDLQIKSLYNTRLHKGLPPGPISNPGLASLAAVAQPLETEYWFYLSDKAGSMHYAKTLEEHNQNIQKYLQ